MQIRRKHWLKAMSVAITLHAAVLIGLKSRTVGEASPAAGPIIEMATALPGVIGSVQEDIDVVSPDTIEETGEPDKLEVKEPDEPEIQETEPVITKKKARVKKIRRSKVSKKKKKKRPKATRKKKKKRSVASKRGNAKKGSAGAKRGGGGRSKANAGAVNRYASRVRARILSRRPSSGGTRGTTVIVFQLSTSGGLRWARISRSSGNGALDRKALGSVRRSSPFPRPPAGSRSNQLRFSIPFRFR